MPKESWLLINKVIENLSANQQIMVKEIEEFHQARIQEISEQANRWQEVLQNELEKIDNFRKERK